jgi:CubicO group peptidase (beta-lactamase class C family)
LRPIDAGSFGHDGAWKTLMWFEPREHLAMVLLVQIGANDPDYDAATLAFCGAATENYGVR